MTKWKDWIIVEDKKTYLFLVIVAGVILYLIFAGVNTFALHNMIPSEFYSQCMIGILVGVICMYFFIRFNTYSPLMNPNHPKPNHK